MPTFAQISSYIQAVGSLTDTEATALIKGAAGWANEGYKHAVRKTGANVAELTEKALTSGTATYSITTLLSSDTDILRLRSLYVTTSSQTRKPLTSITEAQMDEYRGSVASTDTGDPLYYCVTGYDRLALHPTPGAGMVLGGTKHKRPTALSADGDIPSVLPEEFHLPLIGSYGRFKLHQYEGRVDEAREAWMEYLAAIEDCEKDLREFGGHRPARLRPASGYVFNGVRTAWDRMGL